jgi:hypothetical protein
MMCWGILCGLLLHTNLMICRRKCRLSILYHVFSLPKILSYHKSNQMTEPDY